MDTESKTTKLPETASEAIEMWGRMVPEESHNLFGLVEGLKKTELAEVLPLFYPDLYPSPNATRKTPVKRLRAEALTALAAIFNPSAAFGQKVLDRCTGEVPEDAPIFPFYDAALLALRLREHSKPKAKPIPPPGPSTIRRYVPKSNPKAEKKRARKAARKAKKRNR